MCPRTTTSTIDVTTMTPTGATFSAGGGRRGQQRDRGQLHGHRSRARYTATIDWGDGSTPTTGIVSGSSGNYSVAGSHTYADGGTYPVNVTITNAQGLSTLASGTANVTDAALTATPQTITTPENAPLTNLTVATFTDANQGDPISSYGASIDWGDGSPTDEGTITFANGVYTVAGSPHVRRRKGRSPLS